MPDAAAHAYPEGPWLVLAERKPYGEAWVASETTVDLSAWR